MFEFLLNPRKKDNTVAYMEMLCTKWGIIGNTKFKLTEMLEILKVLWVYLLIHAI